MRQAARTLFWYHFDYRLFWIEVKTKEENTHA
jgi:hypothetical protein